MNKPILCLDFDGVIHSYTSGWKGPDVIPDPPVPGAIEFLRQASKHFTVCIYSSRSHQPGGIEAMRTWLAMRAWLELYTPSEPDHYPPDWWKAIEWPTVKPKAMVTLDDRAITFNGMWPSIQELLDFKPWNKRG